MSSYLSVKTKINKSNKQNTLQVCPFDKSADKGTCLKASLTVEAALVLPLILFCMILLMMPLQMMNADRKVQKVCEDVAADVSKYLYTINEYKKGNIGNKNSGSQNTGNINTGNGNNGNANAGNVNNGNGNGGNITGESNTANNSDAGMSGGSENVDSNLSTYMDIADGPALGAFAAARIKSEVNDDRLKIVNVINSDLDSRDDMVTVRIEYAYKLPFNVFDLGFLQQEVTASRRAWVGADGSAETGEETVDEEWVYVGKNPTRYHLTATCHYLYNDWKRAIVGSNGKAGGKAPCEICGKSAVAGQSVYITPNGDKYHTDTGCPAMKAYPRMVRKSEVEHLGCCSYCEKHRDK